MKTKFHFIKPWFSWSKTYYGEYSVIYRGIGFPTTIDYMNHSGGEWSFELTILGFGLMVERFPIGGGK